jgi:hypothetical protein
MKSRRLIAFPEAKDKQSYRFTSAAMHKIAVKYQALSASSQKATLQGDRHMSALLQKSDITDFIASTNCKSQTSLVYDYPR